uniref:50S ribosomal protein L20 n=1 Tax=Cyanidium caldarium TaxID=2771 RepID=A0A7H0WBD0_CYACA|nr:50S ribosomal protein L20 [Cyanidium caldarium]QNR39859.1 50S ribosomal protein L20 [Cyanidium caldarium]
MRKNFRVVSTKIRSRRVKRFIIKSVWIKSLIFISLPGFELNYTLFSNFIVSNFVFLNKKLLAELFVYENKSILLLLYWFRVYRLVKGL